MLEVKDLSVSYGAVEALRSVSFDAAPGAITAVLGANGAGKTTLLRTISGLVKPQSGSVRFDGDALLGRTVETIARHGRLARPRGPGRHRGADRRGEPPPGHAVVHAQPERQAAIDEILELFPRLQDFRRRRRLDALGR